MKKLCAVLIVAGVIVVVIGFYRGWFTLTRTTDNERNQTNVNLTVDRDKMNADAEAAKKKAAELTGNADPAARDLP